MVVEDIDPKTGKPKKDKGQASNTKDLKLRTENYKPLPDVKSAFATLSMDESHRSNNVYSVNKTGSSSAFVSRSNNDWSANKSSNQNSQNMRFNRGPNPNLVCKHCNMIGHTIDRCFELVGYPSGFKKNPKGNNSKASVNNVNTSVNTHVFTSDDYQKQMALLRNFGSGTACGIGNVTGLNLKVPGWDWLPSVVLSGKSPYELVYKSEPSYSHIRTFGCLCFSTVLNNNDKFVERSDKCVFIGYSMDKKGYKLYSLESKQVLFSRDVRFYETVYPFKNQSLTKDYVIDFNDVNSLNFFDNQLYNEPDDEVRERNSKDDGSKSRSEVNAESNSPASADLNAEPMFEPALADDSTSHPASTSGDPERVVLDKNVRRSSIKTSLPSRLKDYEIQGKVKYGLDRYVNYTKLNAENYSFETNLNKTIQPKTYKEASTDSKWVEAMNLEMEALYRNGTWELTILPKGRKAIGSKWAFKINYKSIGEVDRCVISLAIQNGWSIFQFDVRVAKTSQEVLHPLGSVPNRCSVV
ncbi:putative RNA-directed DNA polymerase [Tanacetum coccineum]